MTRKRLKYFIPNNLDEKQEYYITYDFIALQKQLDN